LADIAAQGIADIVNLGDHVSGPMLAAQTADRLMALGFPSIRGDQDRRLLDPFEAGDGASRRLDFRALTPQHFAWMRAQPATMLYQGDVFLCHGSQRDDACYWLDRVRPDGGIEATPLAAVEAEADGVTASLILCAHTHLPRLVHLDDSRTVVNPGSVGLPGYQGKMPVPHVVQTGTPNATYAILEQTAHGWNVTFRSIAYDSGPMAAMATRNGLPDWGRAIATGWIATA
jgi:predicted phosphodiesterase